ncbi:hypothetical protein EV128_125114 [Rhizobium azibense]|nr:hypothetical protein EV128_125114 [Rhizobium azibense]
MKKIVLLAALAVAVSSCANAADYKVVRSGEYQIAGHPYKSATDCVRTAPVGKFDRRCDIPVVGFRGFSDPTVGVQSGGIGGFGVGGM